MTLPLGASVPVRGALCGSGVAVVPVSRWGTLRCRWAQERLPVAALRSSDDIWGVRSGGVAVRAMDELSQQDRSLYALAAHTSIEPSDSHTLPDYKNCIGGNQRNLAYTTSVYEEKDDSKEVMQT